MSELEHERRPLPRPVPARPSGPLAPGPASSRRRIAAACACCLLFAGGFFSLLRRAPEGPAAVVSDDEVLMTTLVVPEPFTRTKELVSTLVDGQPAVVESRPSASRPGCVELLARAKGRDRPHSLTFVMRLPNTGGPAKLLTVTRTYRPDGTVHAESRIDEEARDVWLR